MRRQNGYSISDLPSGVWLFLLFFTFPFISYLSVGYRAALLYYSVFDACHKAGRALTYTTAKQMATGILNRDVAAFTGITCDGTTLSIVEQPFTAVGSNLTASTSSSAAAPTANIYTSPPAQVKPAENSYYIELSTTADVEPLIAFHGGWQGLQIPGLTGPYRLTVRSSSFFENAQGLTK